MEPNLVDHGQALTTTSQCLLPQGRSLSALIETKQTTAAREGQPHSELAHSLNKVMNPAHMEIAMEDGVCCSGCYAKKIWGTSVSTGPICSISTPKASTVINEKSTQCCMSLISKIDQNSTKDSCSVYKMQLVKRVSLSEGVSLTV